MQRWSCSWGRECASAKRRCRPDPLPRTALTSRSDAGAVVRHQRMVPPFPMWMPNPTRSPADERQYDAGMLVPPAEVPPFPRSSLFVQLRVQFC